MMYAHLAHSQSLNDLCDSLELESSSLQAIRRAKAPSRNGISYANKTRSAEFAETL